MFNNNSTQKSDKQKFKTLGWRYLRKNTFKCLNRTRINKIRKEFLKV